MRFPDDFMFQLTENEKTEVVTNCDHLKDLKFSPYLPFAFTEHGALMLANILKSDTAISMSIKIIRIFNKMRTLINDNASILKRLDELEKTVFLHDKSNKALWNAMQLLRAEIGQIKYKK